MQLPRHFAAWTCACWTLIWILCLSPWLWWSRRVGRGVDFWWIQWVWSHPFALWYTGGSFPSGMFSPCVCCICVCVFICLVAETHTVEWVTAEIKHFKWALSLPSGLMFYQHSGPLPWLSDTVIWTDRQTNREGRKTCTSSFKLVLRCAVSHVRVMPDGGPKFIGLYFLRFV